MDDFIRMAKVFSKKGLYDIKNATNLVSLRSKRFSMYQIVSDKKETFPWSRKRYLLSDGTSYPYQHHENNERDEIDRKKLRLS